MQRLDAKIIKYYRQMVEKSYPGEVANWPVLGGHNLKFGKYRGWNIFFYESTGNPMTLRIPLEHLTSKTIGVEDIGSDVELARKKLIRYFRVTSKDMLLLLDARSANLNQELNVAFEQHKSILKIKAGPVPEVEQPKPSPMIPESIKPVIAEGPVAIESTQPLKPVEHAEIKKKEIEQVQEQEEQKETTSKQEISVESQPQRNKVFIINGSSEKMKRALSNFLLSLGLQSMEWAEALSLTGSPDADDAEVISKSFEICQAAVIILTNDKNTVSLPSDESDLTVISRAELNALFAAGLAAGINRHRTVVVGLGNTEPFRNLPGLHMTKLDNSIDKRKELMDRLKIAGCEVKTRGKAWHISGDFEFVLRPVSADKQASSQPAEADPDKKERIPKAQPDKATIEDRPIRRQPRRPAAANTESTPIEPEKGRSFIESLPLLNILMPKKKPINEEDAADLRAELKSKIKPDTAADEITEPTPIVKKPTFVDQTAPPTDLPEQEPVADIVEISQGIHEEPLPDDELPPPFEPTTQTIAQEPVIDTTEAEEDREHGSMYEPTQSELRQLLFEQESLPTFQPEAASFIDEEQLYKQHLDDVDITDEIPPADMDKSAKIYNFLDTIEEPETEETDTEKTTGEREPSHAELECMDRLKELDDKLVELKKRGGRLRKRAMEDIEKQIEVEKQRLNFLRRLADIEKS